MYDAYVAVSNGSIYCTGSTPDEDNQHEVYCCDIKNNQWKKLPRSGHRWGVLHMVDDKLTIFGGRDSTTNNINNKVTTYNSKRNSWYSYYPNMLHNRNKPGVITSHDHVIVMGGKSSDDAYHDSIEVINYHQQQLQWKELSAHLPVPMWTIKPAISGEYITIVGYSTATGCSKKYYKIAAKEVMSSLKQSSSTVAVSTTQWKEMSVASCYFTVTVPYSNPPVIIGGGDIKGVCTSDINLYEATKNLWKKVDSLTSARDCVGVALINQSTIIVIGGTSGGSGVEAAEASSLTTVEIGNIVPNQQ